MDTDLAIFDHMTGGALVQRDILDRQIEYIPPTTSLSSPMISFNVGGGDEFIALDETEFEVGIRIVKSDGTNLTNADKVGCINYTLHSLWKNVDVSLNGTSVSYNGGNQAIRAYMEALLSLEPVATDSWMQASAYHKDTAGKMNMADPNPADASTANLGLKERAEYTNLSQPLVMRGKFHSDIFNQSKPLIDKVNMTIKFHRNPDEFVLMSSMDPAEYKIVIDHMYVIATKLVVAEMIEEDVIKAEVVPYHLNRIVLKEFTIPAGVKQFPVNQLHKGDLPAKVVLGLVDNGALTGDFTKNPYNFQHFDVSEVSLTDGGREVDGQPLHFDFAKNQYVEGYWGLFRALDKRFRNEGNAIKRKDYKNGFTFYAFDLSPSLSGGEYIDPKKDGRLIVNFKFARDTPQTLTLVVYMQFDDSFSIIEGGNITTYFSH